MDPRVRRIRRGWPLAILLLLVFAVLAWPKPARETATNDASGYPSAAASASLAAGPTSGDPGSPGSTPGADATGNGTGPRPTVESSPTPTSSATAHPTLPAQPTAPPPTAAPTAPPIPIPPLSACRIFPSTNVWNRRVDSLPVAGNSDAMIAAIGLGSALHPDFSAAGGYGIPFNVVGTATPRSKVAFQYADESDAGPYPIPAKPKIEGGSDRHLVMIDTNACTLFELYAASKTSSGWHAGSGAIWDLGSNALRPKGWTSADAAGLPIFPGLVRYAEVVAGGIHHAVRFTAPDTCSGYIYPARHEAGSGSCTDNPPMGLRVRLKASVNVNAFGPQSKIILIALQRYGMLLADNGSPWYITGAPDSHWNDDELHHLGTLTGADFEVVDTTGFVNG